MHYLYILRNIHDRLYIGQTDNIQRRLKDHKDGHHGAKFIKDHGDFELVYTEKFITRAKAMRREKQLKSWTRTKKEALIAKDFETLKNYNSEHAETEKDEVRYPTPKAKIKLSAFLFAIITV